MPTRTDRFRGGRTHGRGKKAGRGAGKRGGRGNAGLHKHKFITTLKYFPDHFGRHGFKRAPCLSKADITINLSDITEHTGSMLAEKVAVKKGDVIEIDLTTLGINKLLGTGQLKGKYHLKVQKASSRAVEKVEEAGGKVILP
ncbi:MAG: 50S ribosomal protein L15 [Thermoplasmata archaeon]|nr:MAG: 50S ribosomal protein L15 [Thermoplasmata archaeon]